MTSKSYAVPSPGCESHRTSCPPPGPVYAGGDQGRDFETFRTYIRGLGGHKFGGIGDNQPLTSACTPTAGRRLAAKVRADVAAIMAGGVRPGAIYFFLSEGCGTAKRHQLQERTRSTHAVHLKMDKVELRTCRVGSRHCEP